MYNFIPERKNKIEKSESLEKNLSVEELFLKDIDEEFVDNLEKEKILKKFLENNKFKEIISDIETKEKEMLNLAQFKRFYDFIKEKKFDFFDEEKKIIDFIDKQKPTSSFKDKDNIEYINRHMMYLLEDLDRYLPRNFSLKIRNEIIHKGYIDPSMLDEIIYRLPYDERFNNDRLDQIIHKIKDLQYSDLYDEIYRIKDRLREEIVFYPTYRRVEVGFEKVFSTNPKKYVNRELTTKYMGFGMSDVKNRIRNLLEKLRKDANAAYIEMNANIISELLADRIGNYIDDFGNIDMHKVDVVIKRIGEERIDNIDKLRPFLTSKEFNENDSNIEFLIYYLQNLK